MMRMVSSELAYCEVLKGLKENNGFQFYVLFVKDSMDLHTFKVLLQGSAKCLGRSIEFIRPDTIECTLEDVNSIIERQRSFSRPPEPIIGIDLLISPEEVAWNMTRKNVLERLNSNRNTLRQNRDTPILLFLPATDIVSDEHFVKRYLTQWDVAITATIGEHKQLEKANTSYLEGDHVVSH